MPKVHSDITDQIEIHVPKGFTEAALETAPVKNRVGNVEWRSLSELGATGPEGPAGTTLDIVQVTSINTPIELASEIGTTQGDIILTYEQVADGPNPFSTYTWDTDAGSTSFFNPPFLIPSTGGAWVNTGSGFHQGRLGLDQVSASKFHGSFRHVHREARSYFLHGGSQHQLVSRVGYNRSALSGTEFDFFEANEDIYKTKTLSANTTLTFVGYQQNDTRYLEIDSAAAETLTFPSYVKISGTYNADGSTNYIQLEVIDEGTFATGTVEVISNAFDSGDAVTINGISFVFGTDWVAGASVEESAWNIAMAVSDSSNAAIKGKISVSINGAIITVTDRQGGTAGNAVTLGVTDGATTNFTISGATLSNGVDGAVLAMITQEGSFETKLQATQVIGNLSSTGIIAGGDLSIDTDPAKFDISAGSGRVVDNYTDPENPTYTDVSWSAFDAQTVTNLGTQIQTFICIDINGAIAQLATAPTASQLRDLIFIGNLFHPTLTSISSVGNSGINVGFDTALSLVGLSYAIGPINESGNVFSANGANLNIDRSAGIGFLVGLNVKVDAKDPDRVPFTQSTVSPFIYSFRDGSGGFSFEASSTLIVPGSYDDGDGTLGSVSNNNWTIQRIYIGSAATGIEYGQNTYSSQAGALAAISTEAHEANPALDGTLLRCFLITKGNASDLSDASQAVFVEAGKFGGQGSNGGTSSTTNLQQAYNNSPEPEIVVTASNGAFNITDASTPLAAPLFEIHNNGQTVEYLSVSAGEVRTETQAFSAQNTLTDATTIATDCADGNVHTVTLTANRTLGAPSNLKAGATYIWFIVQDGTGSRTLAYNAVFKFPGGVTPTLDGTAGDLQILSGVSDGTNVYVNLSAEYSP